MKELFSLLKKPGSIRALRISFLIFLAFSLLNTALFYIHDHFFVSETTVTAFNSETDDFTSEMGIFLISFAVVSLITLAISLLSIIVGYKKIYTNLHRVTVNPKAYANLTALIFAIATIANFIINELVYQVLPELNSSAGPEEIPLSLSIGGYLYSIITSIIVIILVRVFALRRAMKEKEELFS